MKQDKHITAFYLEVLLLTVCLVGIVLVLTQVFALGRIESASARELTDAVCLAQNAAEAVSASESAEALCALLNEANNARITNGIIEAGYNADRTPNATRAPAYWLRVTWDEEPGGLARSTITVLRGDIPDGKAIYTLQTAIYRKGAAT